MMIRVASVPSDEPDQARRSKVEVARERRAAGLPYDESRLAERVQTEYRCPCARCQARGQK